MMDRECGVECSMDAKSKQPLVTVIIPSYNHEKYVEQAILSVVTQTYKEIQLIVIDDGSKDGSLKVINRLADLHGFEVVSRENRGLSKTLNQGIALARGKYISFLASDDFYLPGRVEDAVFQFEKASESIVAVCCDGYIVSDEGAVINKFSDRYPRPIIGSLYQNLIVINFLPAMGMTYKSDVLRKFMFDEKYKFEDYTLYLRLFEVGTYKLGLYSAIGFGYRWHGENTSGDMQVVSKEIDLIRTNFKSLGAYYDFKQSLMGRKKIRIANITLNNAFLFLVDLVGKIQRRIKVRNNISGSAGIQISTGATTLLPNFFVVGAAKSGTSSIATYLDAHPDVYVSPIKEPHYFSDDIRLNECNAKYRRRIAFDIAAYFHQENLIPLHIAHIENSAQYLALFREVRNESAIGELSTGYLYSSNAAKNIFDFNPAAKIVMILRQPVRRAYSHYLMNLRDGWEGTHEFMNAIRRDYSQKNKGWGKSHLYVELGLYFEQVKRYLDVFPKEQIKILLYDDLNVNPEVFMAELFNFLEVDAGRLNQLDFLKHENAAALPKSRLVLKSLPFLFLIKNKLGNQFSHSAKSKLRKLLFSSQNLPKFSGQEFDELMRYFSDDINKLAVLIRRDLSHWHTYAPSPTKSDGDQIVS